jgi:hypothetical protein
VSWRGHFPSKIHEGWESSSSMRLTCRLEPRVV